MGKKINFRRYLATTKFGNYEGYHSIDGKFVADGIIRFENLESDTKRVLSDLGIDIKFEFAKAKVGINPKDKHHYSSYYSDLTRYYVYKKFKNDIKRFKYKFNNIAMQDI